MANIKNKGDAQLVIGMTATSDVLKIWEKPNASMWVVVSMLWQVMLCFCIHHIMWWTWWLVMMSMSCSGILL
jgi:hypothetical protein